MSGTATFTRSTPSCAPHSRRVASASSTTLGVVELPLHHQAHDLIAPARRLGLAPRGDVGGAGLLAVAAPGALRRRVLGGAFAQVRQQSSERFGHVPPLYSPRELLRPEWMSGWAGLDLIDAHAALRLTGHAPVRDDLRAVSSLTTWAANPSTVSMILDPMDSIFFIEIHFQIIDASVRRLDDFQG